MINRTKWFTGSIARAADLSRGRAAEWFKIVGFGAARGGARIGVLIGALPVKGARYTRTYNICHVRFIIIILFLLLFFAARRSAPEAAAIVRQVVDNTDTDHTRKNRPPNHHERLLDVFRGATVWSNRYVVVLCFSASRGRHFAGARGGSRGTGRQVFLSSAVFPAPLGRNGTGLPRRSTGHR